MINNIVYVCKGAHHPALFCDYLASDQFSWIVGHPPQSLLHHGVLHCRYKVRYRLNFGKCTVRLMSKNELINLPKTKFSVEICNNSPCFTSTTTTTSLGSESSSHFIVFVKFERPQRCVTPGQCVSTATQNFFLFIRKEKLNACLFSLQIYCFV
jgi:tRNA U34 2-thiouridine synthase MnmA/TrmU